MICSEKILYAEAKLAQIADTLNLLCLSFRARITGSNSATRMLMIARTTSNSISVKALVETRITGLLFESNGILACDDT